MMKRLVMIFPLVCLAPMLFAGYSDGYITAGEYENMVTWRSYDPPLVVDGGGAVRISVRDTGRLTVQSTSTPLGMDVGGVYDIIMYNNSQLLFSGGLTELITMRGDATSELRGGTINYIKGMQFTTKTGADAHIDLYCQDGWSWINNDPLAGIQGKWLDGTSFYIQFINDSTYDYVWTNINVITPEPATLALVGFGSLLLRRKRA